jgi:tellurite resistance protein
MAAGAAAAAGSAGAAALGAASAAGSMAATGVVGAAGAAGGMGTLGAVGLAGGAAAAVSQRRKRKQIDDAKESGREEAMEEAQAKLTAQEKRFAKKMKQAAARFKEHREFEDFLLATFAITLALANCDGEIHPDERQEINEFITGLAGAALPKRLNTAIKGLYKAPPTFKTAFALVEKVDRKHWPLINDALALVVESDGITHKREKAFLSAWSKAKAA